MTQQIRGTVSCAGQILSVARAHNYIHRNEVTDIIPFNEFGKLADSDFSENSAFAKEAQVLSAPELDDLDDTDNLYGLFPRRTQPSSVASPRSSEAPSAPATC